MYGMIHQAARSLVIDLRGEEAWQEILDLSELNAEHFISAQYYGDDITYRLIGVASNYLGLETEVVLEEFGKYWLTFAEKTAYGSVLAMAGDDLETFLGNLDRMHSSISSTMPSAVMPSFLLGRTAEGGLLVAYRSERAGLAPFVKGLLRSVLERFGQTGEVSMKLTADGADFTILLGGLKAA